MNQKLREWADHRTGIETAVRSFLYEKIPASSGWHQVFGSVAVFLFLMQAFTGILLAVNYAPTPGDAYYSLRYILTELTAGAMIHNLHHWTASAMIIAVVLHMAQVFLYGAYKKPREATWMIGVLLMLVTFGFGLTGYLLPWDNKAYWGTVVTTQIAAKAPLLGPYLSRLMGGEGPIGVVTFARFYALHVMLLPALLIALMIFHIYLVRKHGVAPTPGDQGPEKSFFPAQLYRDTVAMFVMFAILFVMSITVQAPLERLADPSDKNYIPRPEWYFLFLFQMLKYLPGSLEAFGAVVLPGLAVATLLAVPFLDRGNVMRLAKRTTAMGVMALAFAGWAGLTAAAILTRPDASTVLGLTDDGQPEPWTQLPPAELAGIGYFRLESCGNCHRVGGQGTEIGPDLTKTTIQRDSKWLLQHFKKPGAAVAGGPVPVVKLKDHQLYQLSLFILKLNPANIHVFASVPDYAVNGAILFEESGCSECHSINGNGMELAPPLNALRDRRTKEWIIEHFRNPSKLSPKTIMEPYDFDAVSMENITKYLLSLPPF
jgi:ubiquinol-cytochrome c reductase cytochrome b subunit